MMTTASSASSTALSPTTNNHSHPTTFASSSHSSSTSPAMDSLASSSSANGFGLSTSPTLESSANGVASPKVLDGEGTTTTAANTNQSIITPENSFDAAASRATPSPSGLTSASSASNMSNLNTSLDVVDPQILEALKSKDRIYVLKLGEMFEGLIKERRARVEVAPATSYQRLLVHRCSAYYKLQPESDPQTKALYVLATSESRIPERRICELVPAELPMQPSFKIMKRSIPDRRKPQSHTGSVAGEDADLSDVEASESGSLGGQSNNTSSSSKKRMTIEQREAAYNEARSRIFMGFEEKEKGKDKDMSASSSNLSVSGSTSTSAGGRSSVGDTDEPVSSPATESEWSTPGSFARDNKRRGGGGSAGGASSSRSLRSGGSFHANGSGSSSRNSRAASPSFTYASLYEPAPSSGQVYDPAQHHAPNMVYHHPTHYAYPYPPPTQGPSPSYLSPYPYYNPSYPYSPPAIPQHNPSDPSSPAGPDGYAPSPPHQMNYGQPYAWPPHPNQPLQSPQHGMPMHIPQQQPQQNSPHQMGPIPPAPPPLHSPPYQQQYNMHPQHGYPYPMNAYYQPPPPQPGQQAPPQVPHPPPPPPHHMAMQQQPQQPHPGYDMPRNMNVPSMAHMPPPPQHTLSDPHFNPNNNQYNPNLSPNGVVPVGGPRQPPGHGNMSPSNSNNGSVSGRSLSGSGRGGALGGGVVNINNNNGGKRGMQPPPNMNRNAWSYGPGLGVHPASSGGGGYSGGNESVGPRFGHSNNSNRRTSGHSSSGGNSRASSNADDVSSIASSSTTSSSSRRTYTSTTSSQQQHPLPPRPDWAVGMKAQPTLASRHHAEHSLTNSRTMSPISPSRSGGQNSPATNVSQNGSLNNTGSNNSPRSATSGSAALQSSTDFPPLTTGGLGQEKRQPVAAGAWSASRPVLSPTLNGAPNPLIGGNLPQSPKPGEDGKIGDAFTPKLVRRTTGPGNTQQSRSPQARPDAAALSGQVASLSLGGEENGVDGNPP